MAEQNAGWTIGKAPMNSNDQWLIKSANRVVGPFKLTEIVMGLELKHFTVLDEISGPFGRWILVRDEQALQAAVKDIRNRAEAIENTATLTHTMTTTKSANAIEEHLAEKQSNSSIANGPKLLKEGKTSVAGVRKSTNGLLVGLLVFLLSGIGTYYFYNKKRSKESASQDGIAQAMQLKAQGFYDRSFALLNRLKLTDKENPVLDLQIGIYQIVLQSQNVVGRKTIERVLGQLENADQTVEAHTAIALSFINEGDFKNATESLRKALEINGQFVPALINKAIVDFKSNNLELAEQDFEPLMGLVDNGLVVLGSTLVSLDLNRRGSMPKRILPVISQFLEDYLKNNYQYQQETQILQAYVYYILNKPQQRQAAIRQLLTSDLESGQAHRYDLLSDRSILNWKNILFYCQAAVESEPREVLSRTFLAYCLSKAGNDFEAKRIILEVEAESPKDPHVAAIKAYIMKSLGQDAEARASLGVALGQRDILSAWLMKSRYCEVDRDDNCIRDTLGQILSINPRSLPAYVGMAKFESRRGNKKAAAEWIERGQAISSTYMPFLEMRNSL